MTGIAGAAFHGNRRRQYLFLCLGLVCLAGLMVSVKDTLVVQRISSSITGPRLAAMPGPMVPYVAVGKGSKPDLQESPYACIDRKGASFGRVEDVFCLRLPTFIPNITNPCFYDMDQHNKVRMRCLPYFYVIGMDKCGTTDLHGRMMHHPLIRNNNGTLEKETQFWSWSRYGIFNKQVQRTKQTIENYLDFFDNTAKEIQRKNSSISSSIITGDGTPMDLWDYRGWRLVPHNHGLGEPKVMTPHFLRYIYRGFVPKFFIQLREPVERLYSDYVFLGYGQTASQFHKDATSALHMMEECERGHTRRWCYYSNELYQKLPARIQLSCYSVYLADWLRVYPRAAFHITRIDEFQADMGGTMRGVFDFMGVGQPPADAMARMLQSSRKHVTKAKTGHKVLPETRAVLKNYFDRCNKETADLLKDDRFLWKDHVH